jgi:CRP-like cAMP-binding protein
MPADASDSKSPGKPSAPERRLFLAGTTIFKEGEPADAAYIMESGAIQIFKMVNGKRIRLANVTPWGLFGELGLIDDSPRMAAAYVTEDAACIVVSKEVVMRMLEGVPESVFVLIQSLVQTIRNTSECLVDARYRLHELETTAD